jgi:hypothetical protein
MYKVLFCLTLFLFGCKPETWIIEVKKPFEKNVLIFPDDESVIIFKPVNHGVFDVGIDYDGEFNSISFTIENGNEIYEGKRVSGTFFPLVICQIPVMENSIKIKIKNRILTSSKWVAVRIAPSLSNMCTPATLIQDDFIAKK